MTFREAILRLPIRQQVEVLGKLVAKHRPESKALVAARAWWATGTKYSNHDFDVSNALHQELWGYGGVYAWDSQSSDKR